MIARLVDLSLCRIMRSRLNIGPQRSACCLPVREPVKVLTTDVESLGTEHYDEMLGTSHSHIGSP
jgi:hypothetical protein